MARSRRLELADLEPVGPGTPVGRYLRLFWQPVIRARDLAPGKARPIEILGEKFTAWRGEDGTPHVGAYRCPHRGTPLSLGWVEGDSLRCRYHGWRFEADGQCVEQPNEDRPFCARIRMAAHPTREYAGLVFAYLGEGEAPPFPTYPDLERAGVVIADPVEVLPCTFWNRFDNDHSHIPWVHRATAYRHGRNDLLVIRHETVEETPYGWRGHRTIKGDPGAEDSLGPAKLTHWFMPNVRLFFAPTRARGFQGGGLWDTKMVWTVPVNDAAHAAFDVTHTPIEGKEAEAYAKSRTEQQEEEAETRWDLAEKVLAGEMTLEDLPDDMGAYTSFAIEDYTTQVGQGPVRGRGPENLAATDARLVLLRRLWMREVSALVNGEPLTQWTMPDAPLSEGSAS